MRFFHSVIFGTNQSKKIGEYKKKAIIKKNLRKKLCEKWKMFELKKGQLELLGTFVIVTPRVEQKQKRNNRIRNSTKNVLTYLQNFPTNNGKRTLII